MIHVPANPSSHLMRAWLFLMRQDMKLPRLNLARLRRRNRTSTAPVIATGGPVVSLTTFGQRLNSVHLALESIGAGSVLPSRLILWLQDEKTYQNRPDAVRQLEGRGLEVRLTENYGPHSKYYPYLLSTPEFAGPLVTADDDVLYSRWWLAGLIRAHRESPDTVHCYRAHILQLENGRIAPYRDWLACRTTAPSPLHFATGGSGCIYPPKLLEALRESGTGFRDLCPMADDVWLHVHELRAGIPVRQIADAPLNFATIPGTQQNALFQRNAHRGENDDQIQKTYTESDLRLLEAAHNAGTSQKR